MKYFVKIICVFVLTIALIGCSGSSSSSNKSMKDQLRKLAKSESELKLEGTYATLADISEGKIDSNLVGSWKSDDETLEYAFSDDGTMDIRYTTMNMESLDLPYTTLEVDGTKLLAVESTISEYDENGEPKDAGIVVTYTAYDATANTLDLVAVSSNVENMTNSIVTINRLYKADDSGSIANALKNAPTNLKDFDGTWAIEDREEVATIKDGKITIGNNTYTMSLDEKGLLRIDDQPFSATFYRNILYTVEEPKEVESDTMMISLLFIGEDENDRPSMEEYMVNWHDTYGADEYRYSLGFQEQAK